MNLDYLKLTDHPIASLFPLMDSYGIDALADDIGHNGLLEPITLFEGKILDGRNRFRACKKIGLAPRFQELPDGVNPWNFAWSRNAERRHLEPGRKSQIRVRQLTKSDEWQAERKRAAGEANEKRSKAAKACKVGRASKNFSAGSRDPALNSEARRSKHPQRKSVAAAAKVSEPTAGRALALEKKRPDLADQVIAGTLTQPQALRQMQREAKRDSLVEHAKCAAATGAPDWQIVEGDCIEELEKLAKGSARLIFADPPYNIGVDYGNGTKADRLADCQYLNWCDNWMARCVDVLTDDGSLWVMICDEYAAEFAIRLKDLGLTIRNWIKWYETFGVNCSRKFNRCSRHIFYCVKDAKRFVFNSEAEEVRRSSDRQTKYNDKRAYPGGKLWDDVWMIPRLVGTAEERIPDFPTQIPLEITRAIVGCASNPGDLVVDPFSGSASTGVTAIELGRLYLGIELRPKFCELSRLRLQAASGSPSAMDAKRKGNSKR